MSATNVEKNDNKAISNAQKYISRHAPLWLHLAVWAAARQDERGAVLLRPGQLRRALGCTEAQQVSYAIRKARDYGLLRPESNARCLWPTLARGAS